MMTRADAFDDRTRTGVGSDLSRNGPKWLWLGRVLIAVVGVVYFAAVFFDIESDGGREAALFFGTFGCAVSYPILLLVGRLLAYVFSKIRPLGNLARIAATVTPAVLLAAALAHDGHRAQNPVTKLERWIVSPAPAGLRCLSAYTYKGINFSDWAFHFTIAPGDLPKILSRRPYVHEVDQDGFDLTQKRDNGHWRPGYPVPPPNFKAVHRYRFHAPTGRIGYDVTLYGDASQTDFFAYGYVE